MVVGLFCYLVASLTSARSVSSSLVVGERGLVSWTFFNVPVISKSNCLMNAHEPLLNRPFRRSSVSMKHQRHRLLYHIPCSSTDLKCLRRFSEISTCIPCQPTISLKSSSPLVCTRCSTPTCAVPVQTCTGDPLPTGNSRGLTTLSTPHRRCWIPS
ncbi:hypothetical protein EDB92DRAFT_306116 [Lactarius akahatsu]|uniref:Secreted protein n=1 Tax=Lactarius akahatsu TaxID=416441 RepID=A0AAD4L9Z8_9AGAM|nr:hypothetical protein EDB92DRAFT_306116 [Lactarius akahatsu]